MLFARIALFVGFLGLMIGAFWATNSALEKTEVVECQKWQQQAKEFSLFYVTSWQDQQCRAHGIVIDAKVEK